MPSQPSWTLKRLIRWVKTKFASIAAVTPYAKSSKLWVFLGKKARKLLNKANSSRRSAFVETLQCLLDYALKQRALLVYIDEAHIHLDIDDSYGKKLRASS